MLTEAKTQRPFGFASIRLLSILLCFSLGQAADWPMLGRDQTRNSVSPETDAPVWWDMGTGHNIAWKAPIGTYTFSQPVVANGLIWVGTNNEIPRDTEIAGPGGALMCFLESDGRFLYQHVSPQRQGATRRQAWTGITCSPLIEGDRLWYVTSNSEILCLDIGALQRGEGLPTELWKVDMVEELGVIPHLAIMGGATLCSIGASYRELIYVSTGNGTDWSGGEVLAPLAPALVCLNRNTGEIVWQDNTPGAGTLFAEWGHPLVIEVDGRGQVVAPQGDGWIRAFDALTGKLIWKFDINPKDSEWPRTRGFFSTAPVFYGGRIYIAIGNYVELGEGPGRLVCIDPTRNGDISLELDDGPGRGKPNPNSGAVWYFDDIDRTTAAVAIKDGLVIAPGYSGLVYCLDADTGQNYWMHDLKARSQSTPLIVGDRAYVADDDGDVCVLELSKQLRIIAELSASSWVSSSPIYANGRLYLTVNGTLYAIGSDRSSDWPQWRGLDRSNVSPETGLLEEWPTNGPPHLWTVSGLGTGIASVSVSGGRILTTGYHEESEFVYALDSASGVVRWAARIGPTVRESALMRWLSQRTPTVDGDRVYTLSADGELFCLRVSDGDVLWQKSYPKDFLSPRPMWGYCDYPLVDGEKLICAPVGPQATMVALNKHSGEVLWQAHVPGAGPAGYSAIVVSEACGIRQYVVTLQSGLAGIAADDGRLLWQFARPVRYAASYTPMVDGDWVFSPNGYGSGMALLRLVREGDRIVAIEEYQKKFNFNPFQDATVRMGDHVYAFEGDGMPVCIEWRTGDLAWGPLRAAIAGRAALTAAEGMLYLRGANGVMVLAEANPGAYTEKGSFQIPDREEASGVTTPVIAENRLYLRDNDRLLCYDVAEDTLERPRLEPEFVSIAPTLLQSQAGRSKEDQPAVGRNRAPDAIYVPTPQDIVEEMLELAEVTKDDVVYDLGSGDGRIPIAAAQKYGARAVGYEIDRRLVELSREQVTGNQVDALVRIEHEDIFDVDLSGADVIALYLPSPLLQRLIPQFEKMKPGARIVSHQFEMPGIRSAKSIQVQSQEDGEQHRLFLWVTPLRARQ